MVDAAESPRLCASCGHALTGDYCSNCGEQALDPGKLTLRYFVTHTLMAELLSLDGKIWRTLRLLLFRPGFLATEYALGRRRPYVSPLRVLTVAIIVYVLATQSGIGFTLEYGSVRLSVAPPPMSPERSIEATLSTIDRFGILERTFEEQFGPAAAASNEIRDRFNGMLNGFATPLSFMTVVLIAVVLYACLHRRRSLIVEHMVFSMHFYSFVLLGLLLPVIAVKLHVPIQALLAVLMLVTIWQFAYLAFATRRFYFAATRSRLLAWTASTGLAIFIGLLNSMFITAVQFAGGALAIARL